MATRKRNLKGSIAPTSARGEELAKTTPQNAGHHRAHSPEFYAEARRHTARSDDAHAFVSDPSEGRSRVEDELAEELAESFLTSATSGEEAAQDNLDRLEPEEIGGPFIEVAAEREFAPGTDPSNPEDAQAEPFPTPIAVPRP